MVFDRFLRFGHHDTLIKRELMAKYMALLHAPHDVAMSLEKCPSPYRRCQVSRSDFFRGPVSEPQPWRFPRIFVALVGSDRAGCYVDGCQIHPLLDRLLIAHTLGLDIRTNM